MAEAPRLARSTPRVKIWMINEPGDDLQLAINTVQRALYTHLENIQDLISVGYSWRYWRFFIRLSWHYHSSLIKIEVMTKIIFNRVGIVSLHKENC